MGAFQEITEKVAELTKLAGGFLTQAAAGLVNTAGTLSLDEISRRLDGALKALRGEEVSTLGAATTREKTSLEIAQAMVDSYVFNKETGVSTFTVPAGVTDVEAMKFLNEYFRRRLPEFNRDAVCADHLEWFENLPENFPGYCKQRDCSQARQITITGVVEDTKGLYRTTQESVLKEETLVFSDPRDQAIAAALHACKYYGEDLFKDLLVRGSVPGVALVTHRNIGVFVQWYHDDGTSNVAASGSPSPESKN